MCCGDLMPTFTFTPKRTREDGKDRTVARIATRLSAQERARLEAVAARYRIPVSDVVRQAVAAALAAEHERKPIRVAKPAPSRPARSTSRPTNGRGAGHVK